MKEVIRRLKEFGYSISAICQCLGVFRSVYYRSNHRPRQSKKKDIVMDAKLLERIEAICREHPFWGYRRIKAWLVHREGIKVGKNKVLKIMQERGLTVPQRVKRIRRDFNTTKPIPTRKNQWWGIDLTKFLVAGVGWVYLVIVVDWYSRKIIGWNIGLRCRSEEWKAALNTAVINECPSGSRDLGINLMADNGSQPTSKSFMKECGILGIKQVFTSYNNPKGNANTERMFRTIKEELIWLNEWKTVAEARNDFRDWVFRYNKLYIHSALRYISPEEFEASSCNDIKNKAA